MGESSGQERLDSPVTAGPRLDWWSERGEATIFLPCQACPRPMDRVTAFDVPAAELAIVIHAGPHTGIDLAYDPRRLSGGP
jgi:hypothetical protein